MLSMKSVRLTLACVAAFALMSVGATAASATPAVFNTGSSVANVNISGTLSVTAIGQTTTCTINYTGINTGMATNSGSPAQGFLGANGQGAVQSKCANGRTLNLVIAALANKNGSAYSLSTLNSGGAPQSPFGAGLGTNWYSMSPYTVSYVNGAGATPSKLVYSNTVIGLQQGTSTLSASGSLNVTKSDGSLLTLS
jgi:hypothetical protein